MYTNEIISVRSPSYIELLINLSLCYPTLTTCIAGTSLHLTQLINKQDY